MYCAFIDFKNSFDTVWREGLRQKVVKSGIREKCFRIIYNMYSVAKSLVFANNTKSEYFMCNIGVRQGENVSPLLFAIFLNDLEQYFIDKKFSGLEECTDSLGVYIKLFLLFYADDTVIITENVDSLQRSLDVFSLYCNELKLSVNTSKSKIMIFSKRKTNKNQTYFSCVVKLLE